MEELFGDVQFGNPNGNFNPDEIDAEETINAVFIVDISPSISNYENHLNDALKDFVETMQKSHVADSLFVSFIEFNQTAKVISGFQPINDVNLKTFEGQGYGTALYDAALMGVENAINYKTQLENSGVDCKTLIFIITDGMDNSSDSLSAQKTKDILDDLRIQEANARNFTAILFGLNRSADFEQAAQNIGIDKDFVARVGTTGKDIRKMINWISSSVSTASSGNVGSVSF